LIPSAADRNLSPNRELYQGALRAISLLASDRFISMNLGIRVISSRIESFGDPEITIQQTLPTLFRLQLNRNKTKVRPQRSGAFF